MPARSTSSTCSAGLLATMCCQKVIWRIQLSNGQDSINLTRHRLMSAVSPQPEEQHVFRPRKSSLECRAIDCATKGPGLVGKRNQHGSVFDQHSLRESIMQ